MNKDQINAVRCAYLDMLGALESSFGSPSDHDWEGHQKSIRELEKAFPSVLSDLFPVED
jgi:hypothetical protein